MIFVVAGLAVGMFLLGRWGRRRAPELVPPLLDPADRARQERAFRRGALIMQAAGTALFVIGLFLVTTSLWRS